ncbi:MAG: FAD-binding oxidoreductase [Rhodobacteraceae bacterium]|nr:FAD-binding oxidoreductase [Paracoccaceae bacterium]
MTAGRDGTEVLIVGGGVMGASAAFWLRGAAAAPEVTVIERDPTYAQAATALSVASVRSQFSNPVNVKISRFGIDFIRDFAAHVGPAGGVPSLGLRENGYLFLAGTAAGAALLEDLAAMQRSLGAATEVLSRAALSARFPWMRLDDVEAGSIGRRDEGWFDNMGLLHGLRNAARARGARFVTGEVAALTAEGRRVTGLRLADGTRMEAGQVLLAAGTRVTGLLATLGEEWPVEPRKRTVFVVDAPEARHPDAPLVIDHTGIYARPEHGQWISATVPEADGPCGLDDFAPDHQLWEDAVWPRLYNRAEGFAAAKVIRFWVGHYDYNRLDQNAILGPHPHFDNLFLASGFSGHGLQQAPAVGRGLAEIMLTGAWQTLDLSELGVARVLAGRPFLEKAIV